MARRKYTVEEIKEYARENYNRGGDVICECWEDKEIQEVLDEGNGLEYFKTLMSIWRDRENAAMYPDGIPSEKIEVDLTEDDEDNYPDFEDDFDDDFCERYYMSSVTCGDYSPSAPWNAPGMSVRDFI